MKGRGTTSNILLMSGKAGGSSGALSIVVSQVELKNESTKNLIVEAYNSGNTGIWYSV